LNTKTAKPHEVHEGLFHKYFVIFVCFVVHLFAQSAEKRLKLRAL